MYNETTITNGTISGVDKAKKTNINDWVYCTLLFDAILGVSAHLLYVMAGPRRVVTIYMFSVLQNYWNSKDKISLLVVESRYLQI